MQPVFCDLKPDSTARDANIHQAQLLANCQLRLIAPFSFLLHFFSLFILRIWISFLRLVHAEEDEMTTLTRIRTLA